MASDKLRQVGKDLKGMNRQANLAMKRVTNTIPKRERARDTVSSLFPMSMVIDSEGHGDKFFMSIDFNKPPPSDCISECIGTTCEDFTLFAGGHSITTINPYEAGTVKVFSNGALLSPVQWYEENPSGGQVYVQVQTGEEMIVVCYSYIAC